MVPDLTASFNFEDVLKMEYEEVPLHEFIRTFGERLENNYKTWNKVFGGVLV